MDNVSAESLENLNQAVEHLFDAATNILDEAGVPRSTSDDAAKSNTAALGASQSVPTTTNISPAPFLAVGLCFFAGVSLLITAFIRQYHRPSKAEEISAAVNEIVAKYKGE